TDLDSLGKTYVGGNQYSQELLVQADIISTAPELGWQSPDALVNEAIAFLANDDVDDGSDAYSDGGYLQPEDHQSDGLQSMLSWPIDNVGAPGPLRRPVSLRGARMSGNHTDAANQPLTQGNSDTQGGYSLAEALRALEAEIERELADLDEALGELRDGAAVERVSTTVAKPATPCANGQAQKPQMQIRPAAPFVQSPALKLAANGRPSFVVPPRQSRPASGQPRVEVPPTARPKPQ